MFETQCFVVKSGTVGGFSVKEKIHVDFNQITGIMSVLNEFFIEIRRETYVRWI